MPACAWPALALSEGIWWCHSFRLRLALRRPAPQILAVRSRDIMRRSVAQRAKEPCRLTLVRQVDGRDRGTVRRGEHPRASVHRLDLLDDDELDRFRALHPVASIDAMDSALALEEGVERALAERGIDSAGLAALPTRPILAVFVCFACGAWTAARATRDWEIDRAMRSSGLGEREVLAVRSLVRASCGERAPPIDALDADALLELGHVVGRDVDHEALAERIAVLSRRGRADRPHT